MRDPLQVIDHLVDRQSVGAHRDGVGRFDQPSDRAGPIFPVAAVDVRQDCCEIDLLAPFAEVRDAASGPLLGGGVEKILQAASGKTSEP